SKVAYCQYDSMQFVHDPYCASGTFVSVGERLPQPPARPGGHLPRFAYPLVGGASSSSERGIAEICLPSELCICVCNSFDDQTLRTPASTNKATPKIAAKTA